MTAYRKKGFIGLGLVLIVGLTLLFFISDRRAPAIKSLNAAFGTHVSGRARRLGGAVKPPSFQGDGVSYDVFQLDPEDMRLLKRDLKKRTPARIDSKIGETVRGDLSIADHHAADPYPLEPLDRFQFFLIDRSPNYSGAVFVNYDALLVDERDRQIVYFRSDA